MGGGADGRRARVLTTQVGVAARARAVITGGPGSCGRAHPTDTAYRYAQETARTEPDRAHETPSDMASSAECLEPLQ